MIPYVGPEVNRLQKLKMHAEEERDVYAKRARRFGSLAVAGLAWGVAAGISTPFLAEAGLMSSSFPLFSTEGGLILAWGFGLPAFITGGVMLFPWHTNKVRKDHEEHHIASISKLIKAAQEGVLEEHA